MNTILIAFNKELYCPTRVKREEISTSLKLGRYFFTLHTRWAIKIFNESMRRVFTIYSFYRIKILASPRRKIRYPDTVSPRHRATGVRVRG